MRKNVLRLMGTVAFIFLGLTCGSSMAIDTMSWSPRTPAGGAFVGDSSYWLRQALLSKWGSEAFYLGARNNTVINSQTSEVIGGDRRYGDGVGFDEQGNVILFNFKGDQIEKKDHEIVSLDERGRFYYFTPQTSHVTTTQITESRAP
mgnify:CR=1 FL=1